MDKGQIGSPPDVASPPYISSITGSKSLVETIAQTIDDIATRNTIERDAKSNEKAPRKLEFLDFEVREQGRKPLRYENYVV
jgi:hypothetical protein